LTNKTFKDLEHDGWMERAESYDLITPVTDQAIEPLLATFGELRGQTLLEVASGPGHLAAQAADAGANVTGIDFAASMVARAQARFPVVTYREGDAEHLDFPDNHFDAVVCAFGLLHLEHPDRAIAEAFRVLKPGGRYTYSVWCAPEQGGDFFGFLMGAIQRHGDLHIDLPPAPPFYRFAAPAEAESALTNVGFTKPQVLTAPVFWRAQQPSEAVDVIYKGTVRTKLMLEAQTEAARKAIHAEIISGVEKFRVDGRFEIAMPAVLVTATKPT